MSSIVLTNNPAKVTDAAKPGSVFMRSSKNEDHHCVKKINGPVIMGERCDGKNKKNLSNEISPSLTSSYYPKTQIEYCSPSVIVPIRTAVGAF